MSRGKKFTAEQIIGKLREAEVGLARAGCGPIVEAPRSFLSTPKAGFFSSAQRTGILRN